MVRGMVGERIRKSMGKITPSMKLPKDIVERVERLVTFYPELKWRRSVIMDELYKERCRVRLSLKTKFSRGTKSK